MKVETYNSEDEWKEGRLGRITGTRAGSLLSKRDGKPLKEYYTMLAERIAVPHDGENVMDRGHRLEEEAVERLEKELGKVFDKSLVIVSREDEPDIAYSPDAFNGETESVEVKCLNSAAHIEAILTGKLPSEYEEQSIQPFVVNDALARLFFVMYDPRMPKDFVYFVIEREEIAEKSAKALDTQRRILAEMRELENKLTF